MRKNNVWKQALALVLSATLVLGNVSPVSAATSDAGTDEGAGNPEVVTVMDAIELTAEGEQTTVSGSEGYVENGIKFVNSGVEIVDAPIITPGEGDEPGDDGGHGKVFKFKTGTQKIYNDPDKIPEGESETGVSFLTSVENAFANYDFSNGVSFSFDIYPDQQATDWNYLFAGGVFETNADKQFAKDIKKDTVTGTMGFVAAFDSEKKKLAEGNSFQMYTPHEYWIDADRGGYRWNYFVNDQDAPEGDRVADHIHKWYTLKYSYTAEGMTISINGKPIISYFDNKGYVEDILTKMNKGSFRFGKGILTTLEGYQGLMDNIKIEPLAPHQHTFAPGTTEDRQEPTCTENGYINKGQCIKCGNVIKEVIRATGHSYGEIVSASDATCTSYGYGAHYECEECGQWAVADGSAEGGKKEVESDEIKIDKLEHDYETVITKATTAKDGTIIETCKREGCTSKPKTTVIPKASNIALAGTSFTYTGKEIKPAVTVKDSEGTVITTDNYDVTYSNNVKVGTATVTIKFKGANYEGAATKTFVIKSAAVPAKLTLGKASVTLYTGNAKKSETVKVTSIAGASKAVTWRSDNPKIAKVDNKGKITAVKKGTTNVRATANGITRVVKVTVKNPTITLKNGKKKFTKKTVQAKRKKKTTLTVSVSPSKSGFKLGKMTSKQKKIAKVTLSKKGKLVIQGKKKGSFKIKITSGKTTKTLTIKVK